MRLTVITSRCITRFIENTPTLQYEVNDEVLNPFQDAQMNMYWGTDTSGECAIVAAYQAHLYQLTGHLPTYGGLHLKTSEFNRSFLRQHVEQEMRRIDDNIYHNEQLDKEERECASDMEEILQYLQLIHKHLTNKYDGKDFDKNEWPTLRAVMLLNPEICYSYFQKSNANDSYNLFISNNHFWILNEGLKETKNDEGRYSYKSLVQIAMMTTDYEKDGNTINRHCVKILQNTQHYHLVQPVDREEEIQWMIQMREKLIQQLKSVYG